MLNIVKELNGLSSSHLKYYSKGAMESSSQSSIHYAYCFEAKSVQSYLFAGSKLRHLVSASELLERLTGSILDTVTSAFSDSLKICEPAHYTGANNTAVFARRSAGAFYLVSPNRDSLTRLRLQVNLLVEDYLPGLSWVDDVSSQPQPTPYKAVRACLQTLNQQANINYPNLPVAPPIISLCERTAEPALAESNNSDNLDVSLFIKEHLQKNNRESFFNRLADVDTDDSLQTKLKWPLDLENDFPSWDKNYIAIIHIDGNGLGQLLMSLQEAVKQNEQEYLSLYPEFSAKLKQATEASVKQAITTLYKDTHFYGARPIVVGGDDITFMVRAPEALYFTDAFINAFEANTALLIAELRNNLPTSVASALPVCLSACAGIAFCNISAPFSRVYERAEELCALAKKHVKSQALNSEICEVASSIAFEQLNETPVNEYQAGEMGKYHCAQGGYLSLEVYHTGRLNQGQLPSLQGLIGLGSVVKQHKLRGKLKDYFDKRKNTPKIAEDFADKLAYKHPNIIADINRALDELYQGKTTTDKTHLFTIQKQGGFHSPLADLIELINMGAI